MEIEYFWYRGYYIDTVRINKNVITKSVARRSVSRADKYERTCRPV